MQLVMVAVAVPIQLMASELLVRHESIRDDQEVRYSS